MYKKRVYYVPLIILIIVSISSCFMISKKKNILPLSPDYLKKKYETVHSSYLSLEEGTKIHYQIEGNLEKPAVFLIHGAWSSLYAWDEWVKLIQDEFRIIRLDLPAHGLTGPGKTHYFQPEHAFKIIDALANHLNIQYFILVGNSLGGHIAWRYALTHQDRVKALVLIDSAGSPENLSDGIEKALFLLKIPFAWRFMSKIPSKEMVKNGAEFTYENKAIITDEHVLKTWELMRFPGSSSAFAYAFSKWSVHDKTALQLRNLNIPVLILWGKEDRFIPVQAGYWFDQTLPLSDLIIYEKTGHAPMEERPVKTVEDFMHFLKKHGL